MLPGRGRTRPAGPGSVGPGWRCAVSAAVLDLVLVVLSDGDGDLLDLMLLLVAVYDTEVPGMIDVITPQAMRPSGNRCPRRSSGSSVHARCDPGAPACLPRNCFDPRRRRWLFP